MQALVEGVWYLWSKSGKMTERWKGNSLPMWPSSCHQEPQRKE